MKSIPKIILTVLSPFLLINVLAGATGKTYAQSPVSFGMKGGLNVANIVGADRDVSTRPAMTIGASVDVSIPALPVDVESGVYFSQKGAKPSAGTIQTDYVEIPVLAKVYFGTAGMLTPHLVAGPTVAFNVHAQWADVAGPVGNLDDDIRRTEFGGLAGIGTDINLGYTKLNAQLRYQLGFTPLFKDGVDEDGRNGVFSIVAGIRF